MKRIALLILTLLLIFSFSLSAQDTEIPIPEVGGYPELLELHIPLTGSWRPGDNPLLIEAGDYADIANMRPTNTGVEGVSGYSKINSTIVNSTYLKIKNGFHFIKDEPAESHVLVQAYNSGLTASQVYENETAIPSAGDFNATELHTDGSGASKGRFASAPQGTMVYCNEADRPQVWPGDEGKCMAFITSTSAIGNSITNPQDYTERVQNTLQTSDEVATVGGTTDYSLLLHMDGADAGTSFPNSASTGTITAATIAFVDSNPDTITDSGSAFVSSGFVVGSITVSGSVSNDGTYVVDTVAAGTLTLDVGEALTAEGAGATVTITLHPVTATGDAQTDTDQFQFPSASCLLDGNGDYLTIPDSAHWYMGTGNTTIDMWVRWASLPTTAPAGDLSVIWSQYLNGSNYAALYWQDTLAGADALIFRILAAGGIDVVLSYDWTPSLNTWYHIAVIRGWGGNADSWALCVDGTAQATTTDSDSWPDLAAAFDIGYGLTYYLDGNIDEFRIWKGTAAWQSNFTPPSREYGISPNYWLIGSPWTLDGVKLYIASANISTSTLGVEEWTGTGWSSLSVTDNTSSGGISLAATGTVTWDNTETTSKPKFLNGYNWYWYQFTLSAGGADVYYATVSAPVQNITNIWDGTYSTCAGAKVYEATNDDYWDYTEEINSELTTDVMVLDSLEATNDFILLGFAERQQGVEISFVATEENDTAATTLAVYYWDGDEWVAVSGLYDGTSVGSISFNRNGVIMWTPPSQNDEFPKDYGEGDLFYYYKLVFDQNLAASVDVYFIEGIPATDDVLPYAFPLHFQNRTLLFNRNGAPSEALVSSENTSYIFNGPDSSSFNIGTDTALTAAASLSNSYDASIDAVAIVCKDSETWALREPGDGGPNFIQHQLSKMIGCPAPLTMDTCEIVPGMNVVMWLSYDGPVMCDGINIKPIPGIEPYFDPIDSLFLGYSNLEPASGFIDSVLKEYNLIIGDNWLIYDIQRDKWFKKEPPVYPECGWRVRDTNGGQYCYLGYDAGYMYRNEYSNAFDGLDIDQSLTLADIAPAGLWFESQLDFLKLTSVSNDTGDDYTDYTEVDIGADRLTVAYDSITVTTVDRDEEVYAYKDFGADYFNGDFQVDVNFNCSEIDGSMLFLWAMANSVDHVANLISDDCQVLYVYESSGDIVFKLAEYNAGSDTTDNTTALSITSTYYLTVKRDESVGTYGTLYCYVYSSDARDSGSLVDTLTITLTEKKDWRYRYAVGSYDDASSGHSISGTITGVIDPISFFHRSDGDNSWTTLRSVPIYESGKRYVQHIQRPNKQGVTHQLKLGCSTNDRTKGMEPLSIDLRYRLPRTGTVVTTD